MKEPDPSMGKPSNYPKHKNKMIKTWEMVSKGPHSLLDFTLTDRQNHTHQYDNIQIKKPNP